MQWWLAFLSFSENPPPAFKPPCLILASHAQDDPHPMQRAENQGADLGRKCPLLCDKGHGVLELEVQLLWRATEMLPHMLPAAKAPPGIGMHVNRFDALAGRAVGSAILRDHMGNSLLNCKGVHSSGERPTDRQLLTKPSRCWLNGARSRVMRFRMPASGVMRVDTFCRQTSRVHP